MLYQKNSLNENKAINEQKEEKIHDIYRKQRVNGMNPTVIIKILMSVGLQCCSSLLFSLLIFCLIFLPIFESRALTFPAIVSLGFFNFNFFFFFCFLGPYLQHMEVPGLGIELELPMHTYATATAMPDPSHVCDLHHSLQQCWILNLLSEFRDQTCSLTDTN